jgi:probable rRNA maturation factor
MFKINDKRFMQDLACDSGRCAVSYHVLITINSKRWAQKQLDLDALCFQVFQIVAKPYKIEFEVSLVFTSNDNIQKLNLTYRGKNQPTNVLSFPSGAFHPDQRTGQPPLVPLGDVVLAYETIEHEAIEQGIPFQDHLIHLMIHGFLHLLGYDHEIERDAEDMESLEIQYLQELGIDNPYLVRE